MKMKKLVSAIAALAMSVSAFTGLATVAHADTTVLYERGYETAWTADDATAWGATELTADYGLHQSGGNGDNAASITVSPEANSIINVEAQWIGMSNTGRNFAAGNGSYFRFGNTYVVQNDQDKGWGYNVDAVNGETACKSISWASSAVNAYREYDVATKNWYVISMEIDTASNTLNYFRVYSSTNPTAAIVNVENQTLSGADYSTIAIGYEKTGGVSTTNDEYLKSIKVTQTTQTVETADYTINYVCGQETVKSVTNVGVVGQTIDAETVFTADNGTKYFAADGATTSIVLAANGNVLEVAVREANKYTVTANATGTVEQTITTVENVVEGEDITYSFPRYIADGTALNQVVLSRYDQGYQKVVSNVVEDTVSTVEYAAVADTEVVYYSEAENIEGAVAATSGNIPVRCSDSAAAYFADDAETEEVESTVITTLPAGKYVLSAAVFGGAGTTFTISAGDTVVLSPETVGYFNETSSEEFTLTEDTVISIAAGGNAGSSPKVVDYIYVVKTGDVTVDPSEPPVDPSEPPVDPSEPPVDPSEPPVDPSEPPVEATPDPDSPYASGNLITNGDFTNGTTDWTNAADGGVYAGTISDNAEYIHGDGKALTNTASAGGSAASTMRRFVPVEAGKKYYLSFYVYNATGAEISGFGPMSAFVPVVGNVFGSFNGLTFKDYVQYGGQNSWSAEPQSEVNQARVDLSYAPGMNHKEFTITVPEGAENIMLSMFAWTDAGTLYFSDFELYELKPELTVPEVAVAEFGTFDSDTDSKPAKAFTGTFTVDAEANYPVSSVVWTVGTASATSTFDTVISGGTVVTGLVVLADDLAAIPTPTAEAVAAE